jgi:hypothetical protein
MSERKGALEWIAPDGTRESFPCELRRSEKVSWLFVSSSLPRDFEPERSAS